MECKDYREQFPSVLNGSLNLNEQVEVKKHLAGCRACDEEFASLAKVWNLMGEADQPEAPAGMQENFESILTGYNKNLRIKKLPLAWIDRIITSLRPVFSPQPALSIFLAAAGLLAGYLLHSPEKTTAAYGRQIDSLSLQISEMKQIMVLSMLQDQSASRRIQAVSYTDEVTNPDKKITDALFTTLNEDPNVNVRLATLEALAKLADSPVVREGLIRSIELQDSPIMQSSIADIMVKLHEKKSVISLRKLLEKEGLNQMVKKNIEKSIEQLI